MFAVLIDPSRYQQPSIYRCWRTYAAMLKRKLSISANC
jgi:hypothetical protein